MGLFESGQWIFSSFSDTKAVLNQCKLSIKETAGILHGNNVYATRVLDFAMDAAIVEEQWELALKYGNKALHTYR